MATMTKTAVTAVLCTSLVATGCATTQEGQQMQGAALGALAGGLATGLLTGNVGYGLAGAAAGAALGWGAAKLVQYNTPKTRTVEQDQQLYGFTPSDTSVLVKMNRAMATPDKIAPGQQVDVFEDYTLSVPPSMGTTEVTKSFTVKKDGAEIFSGTPEKTQAGSGGYSGKAATIPIPSNAKPGTYVVEMKVQAGTSYDTSQAVFVVGR